MENKDRDRTPLGSVADAEDMLQETFIRWQQAADEEIRSA